MTAQEFKALVLKEIDGAIEDNGPAPNPNAKSQFPPISEDLAYWQGRVDALRSLRSDIYLLDAPVA